MDKIREISRGGFGVVDEVRLPDGTVVARKTFEPVAFSKDSPEYDKLKRRFEREVRQQSALKYDSICPVLDSDLRVEEPWFTMPLAKRNLQEEIVRAKAKSKIPKGALADILSALEKLHSLSYVHRDLKPQNVLLVDGTWKLSDFGLILPPSGSTTKLTSVGSAWGTAEYAAPEQSAEFHAVTGSADIYAFGCILHDIFVGTHRVPYSKHTGPGKIGGVIERCTDQRRNKRFASISALRSALNSALSENLKIVPSSVASDWANAVSQCNVSTHDSFGELIRFIRTQHRSDDIYAIFHSLENNSIDFMHKVDAELWKILANEYCQWIEETSFSFSYCDLLAQNMRAFFTNGDSETKSEVAIALAELAVSHNRWFVMDVLVGLCGKSLDESTAERIAIDIAAFDVQRKFAACAGGRVRSLDAYHPRIREVIEVES